MKALLKVIKIDETKYWRDDIVKQAKKLFGVYIYDSEQETFCCEITPSYYLHFLSTFAEEMPSDELYEIIRTEDAKNGNQDMYMHVSEVDKIKVEKEYTFEYEGDGDGEDYTDKFEEILEYESGNPTVC